jgi:hypothetical protein
MTDEIRPVGGPGPIEAARERREGDRRQRQRRDSRELVPVEQAEDFQPQPAPARAAALAPPEPSTAAFVAQQIGQTGQKRGLRGGPPVLDAARAAYLGTEYSGEAERRPPVGKTKQTDI